MSKQFTARYTKFTPIRLDRARRFPAINARAKAFLDTIIPLSYVGRIAQKHSLIVVYDESAVTVFVSAKR